MTRRSLMASEISARRTFQGAWALSTLDREGYFVERQYMGYTKRDALRLFRGELQRAVHDQ